MPGSQTGGTIVQRTDPTAAYMAGSYGAMAANEASQIAQQSTKEAIANLNQQYQNASLSIQPYQQTGVQALDQLNQYLGLNPYTPSNAPIAPVAPTLENERAKLSPSQINQYILGNTIAGSYSGSGGGTFANQTYIGGAGDPNFVNSGGAAGPGQGGAGDYGYVVAAGGPTTNPGNSPFHALGMQNIRDDASYQLANTALQQDQPIYDVAKQTYQTNLANYNQDMGWADQYKTPLTSAQVQDNIINQPGYQAQLGQGINAIQTSAASKGLLGSGGLLKQLMSYGQNTLNQYYGQTLSRLAGLAGAGADVSKSNADQQISQGNSLAQLYTQLGNNQANAALSAGNSLSTALIAANQQYDVMGQSSSSNLGGIGSLLSGGASLLGAL